jgi:glycerophosphoryl diester phosphodiesterase
LDAGSHFDVAYRGEPIPLLDDVLEALGRQTYTNIELTNYASFTDRLPDRVAEIVKHQALIDRVFFSSFNPIGLARIHRLLPEPPIGLLAQPGNSGAIARSWLGYLLRYQSLNPALENTDNRLIARIHRRNCRVLVYTVNDPEAMRHMFDLGVDGIFTDDPLTARRVLSTGSERRLKDRER